MPGTTRYSATFDRTYEEDDRVGSQPPANQRRSRSMSLQALSGSDGRPYTPLGARPPSQRSSSTDSGAKGPDHIPTRTVGKTAVKAHNNPFQFVKVGTCPLYKRAEELLQKSKEVKKQDVFREEEEEWQSNLDSWKSRRRKMSEDVFRRQEEIKQFELEEQSAQVSQKKTKTFSEMVESRANRGRTLSLCLLSSPLEFQDWEFENKSHKNGSCSTFTDESEENSTVNSEDEGVSLRGRVGRPAHRDNQNNHRTNGDVHSEQNGSKLETHNGDFNNGQMKPKEGSYIDSGLESISSSHRAGDTPDSGSDFSQDSNSSIDCESPRTGVNILEEFSSKSLQMSPGQELSVKLSLTDKTQELGFQFQGGKDAGQVLITSVSKGSKAESSGIHVGDQIIAIEGTDVSSKKDTEIASMVQKGREKGAITLLLWRHTKTANGFNSEEKHAESPVKPNKADSQNAKSESQQYEKSIESENEMYVDDFEELQRQSELLTSSKKSEVTCTNSQGVYALDVSATPNPIPPEGIPVNSLYPLSPVTELPSPADETKTMSSTLSSKPTTPVSNSANGILLKEKGKETEVKLISPTIKENNKITSSVLKSVSSKTAVPSDKDESKNASTSIPSSPTVTKNKDNISLESSVEEKSKLPSSPKKVKVKVKKANTLSEQKSSESSQVAKETPPASAVESSALPVKKLEGESQPKKVQRSDSLTDDKPSKVNKNENVEPSQKRENNAGSAPVTPEAKPLSSKGKAVTTTISSNTSSNVKNLALKIEKQNESVHLAAIPPVTNNKQPKTPQDDKASSSLALKKEKTKLKENGTPPVETDVGIQVKSTESNKNNPVTSSTKSRNVSLNTDVQNMSINLAATPSVPEANVPKSPYEEKSNSALTEKKEKSESKEENNVLTTETVVTVQEANSTSSKDKTHVTSNAKSSVKNRNLSLNIHAQNHSVNSAATPPVSNVKPPRTPKDDKSKSSFAQKKEKTESKVKSPEQIISSDSSQEPKETFTITITTCSSPAVSLNEESQIPVFDEMKRKALNEKEKIESSEPVEIDSQTAESAVVIQEAKSTDSKGKTSAVSPSTSTDDTRNLLLNSDAQNQSVTTPPVVNAKPPKTPQEEKSKPSFTQKKEKTKSKDSNASSAETATVIPDAKSTSSNRISVADTTTDSVKTRNLTLKISAPNQSMSTTVTPPAVNAKQPKTPADEKSKPSFAQKNESTKPKNANSQKVNSPAKQNEELVNLNIDSLNVIFQSEPKSTLTENQSFNVKSYENNSNKKATTDFVPDIPPVEKVAEEMEKLILEQLEEEERAKELASETKNAAGSPEHLLIAPPRLAEPPKEKPPPPPSANEGSQKDSSLKRVNSTKRIKKEIHKRRSNFLGIENADESIVCNEPSIPPPPALEEILKAEMELDRQSRLKIENAATERLTMEEKEIMQKEREIIESLESEERQKQLLNGTEDFKNVMPTTPGDVVFEDDRILSLQSERKRLETERFMTDEQQLHILEEKQLREREEFIRKQEASKSAGPHSDSSLSVAANAPNNSKPALSSLTETKSKVSLSDTNGDGKNVTSNSSSGVSENKSSECDGKDKASEKPAVPPKPLKKKEAIRKERERLRQEQEALQREREEHRRKLLLEQEELMKHQKSHAPDAPVTQLGPLPPLVPPNFPPQLTTTMNATPNARESASFPSRSHHGAPNGAAGSINAVELMGPPIVRQNRTPASRKAVQNEAWGQQKMPSVRKQNHDSLTESRYNQNHWLIQEAEMRRITELKERQQRASQLPCSQTHLAEDDVCSNPPRVPVITPTHNQHLNYAVQDKMWNYGQSNVPPKKYPPPAVKDPLHTVYPREAVSQQPPTKPSRVVPMERQEQMLSVSGRKRCSHCNEELGRGAAMIIESLQLYYHIHCFQCCVCQAQLGNGSCGTDVRVRNNKLHCHNCYSNDEAGLKFSQV